MKLKYGDETQRATVVAPPHGGAWIEIERQKPCESHTESPPSRGGVD